MTFLPTLDEAIKIVEQNDAFEMSIVEIEGCKVYNFGYLLPGYMDFEEPIPEEKHIKAYELRGLTFVEYPNGDIQRYLLLPKFFGYNQTKGYMHKDISHKEIKSASLKLDGSLVRFIPINGKIFARTKNSFFGIHADIANNLLKEDENLFEFVSESLSKDISPIFELVSPDYKIVLDYPETKLNLTQMRKETGDFIDDIEKHPLVQKYNISHSNLSDVKDLNELIERQKIEKNIEGWVIRFSDNQMIKVKTIWYDDMHDHFFEKNHSTKKMISMVANETMDDALSLMDPSWPAREKAETINISVSKFINETVKEIKKAVSQFEGNIYDNEDRKAFTLIHKGNPLLGLYMQSLKDQSSRNILGLVKGLVLKSAKTEDSANKFLKNIS